MEKPRMLKRETTSYASYGTVSGDAGCDVMTAACATELMNAASSFHKLHLKVKGTGSFAAHKALNEIYDALPDHADTLIEGYQGAAEKILEYKEVAPRILNTVEDGGETFFEYQDVAIKPERGKIVIFPTDWTYLHGGKVPYSSDKWISTSFVLTAVQEMA